MQTKLFIGASVAALMLPGIALAQDAPAAVAQAPQADDGDAQNEIVVIAQKREENVTKVPIAITVVSDRLLQATDSKNLVQLQGVVPGLTVQGDRSYGGANLAIRGTSGATTPLQDDPVAIYVDGVYTPPNLFGTTALSDISGMEVVRGPQGTLQGRNATAGAILVRTADPSSTFGGYIRAQVADPKQYRVEAAVTGPLGDNVSVRLSADHLYERGWAKNDFNGSYLGGVRATNIRATLLWKADRFKLRLSGDYQKSRSREALARWSQSLINPTGQAITTPTPTVPLTRAQQERLYDGHFYQDVATFYRNEGGSAAMEATYDLGGVDLVSITGFNQYDTPGQTNSSGLAVAPRAGYNVGRLKGSFYSEEIRLQSNGDGPFKWLVGGYASHSKSSMNFNIFNLQVTVPVTIVSRFDAHQKNDSLAGFADVTYNLTPELAVTGGIRYTSESKDFHNSFRVDNVTTGATTTGPLLFNPAEKTWHDTSYRAKATYSPTPDSMLYASYSRGFKSGGFNAFTVGSSIPFNPERLTSAEVGFKADLWDRRAHVALSAYRNDYKNLQVTVGVPAGGVVITNAASATIKGFELEGQLRPATGLLIEGNLAYTDGHYDTFLNAPNLVGVLTNASGNRLPNAPKWQYFAQATYSLPVGSEQKVELSLNWRWRDTVFYTATNQDLAHLRSGPDGELGGRIKLTDDKSGFGVSVFGSNLTDKRVINSLALAFAYPAVSFNRPRTIGLQVEKKF